MTKNQQAIAVLSYNHPELTARCLRSLEAQASGYQILLIHNGSEQRWVNQLQAQFPKIEHLVLAENTGFSGGANRGLEKLFSDFSWVLFLTNDTQLLQLNWTPLQPGLYAPLIYGRKPGHVDSLGGSLQMKKAKLSHLKEENQSLPPEGEFYVPGTAFLLHREIFQATGGFDESLHTYWEDVDLSLRAKKLNLRVACTTEIRLSHSIGKTCHKDSYYTTYLYQRNRKRICLRHCQNSWQRVSIWLRVVSSLLKMASHRALQKRYQVSLWALRAVVD